MIVFKEISISGEWAQLEEFMNSLPLNNGWERNRELEEKAITGDPYHKPVFGFSAPSNDKRQACTLWFHSNDSRTEVALTNIVPREIGQLTKEQYNAILDEFFSSFVSPHSHAQGLVATVTSDTKNLADFFPEETARKLRTFSLAANMSTGSSHPLDQKRWIDFIISAFQIHTDVSGGELSSILIEELGWPADMAHSLAGEYDFGREVLKQFSEL